MVSIMGLIADRSTFRCLVRYLVFGITLFLLWADWAVAEEPKISAEVPKISAPPLVPIPLSDIPTRASAERTALDQAEILLAQSEIFDQIENELLDQEQVIARDLMSLSRSLAAASSREAISEIENKWLELDHSLLDSETKLRRRTTVIQQQLSRLDAARGIWKLTVNEARDAKAPAAMVSLARATANDVVKVHASLQQMQDRAISLQGKVGRARIGVQNALDRIKAEEASLLNNLTRRERPPLWSEAIAGITITDLTTKTGRVFSNWWASLLSVVRSEYDRVIFQILLLLILAMILRRARKAARAWSEADPSIAKGMSVFERPFALATLLVLMLTPWLYVSTPPELMDAVGLLLVFPVLLLLLPLFDVSIRPALLYFAILYIADQLRDMLEAAPLVARIIFIIEMIAAIGIIVWVIRSKSWQSEKDSKWVHRWQNAVHFALSGAVLILIVATLAAMAGYVRLAVLLGSGVLNSIYLALLLVALKRAVESIVILVLHSHAAQSFSLLKTRTKELRRHLGNLLGIIAMVIWVFKTLDLFALREYVGGTIKGILFTEFQAGAIVVSLADVLAFIVTILGAILLARLIVLVLDEDVYPRVKFGRGVSFAISSVIKYGIIVLGFLVAVGAMGMGMDRITILLGAFGVGLGFGLQTIVNNFVSGMILIFERPVQIGDSVEIGSVKGNITRIGIRSSTVRTFEGADVTVPNGTLLSDALTNWTMTDRNRRIEIAVGVAYGTDPDKVIEALYSTLEGQEGLLQEPPPRVLFNGFGDNSLDFLLRAWVADNDEYVKTRSDIALAMNRALNERGIEIPFPQRDIHLRSISPDVSIPGKA